MSSKDPLYRAWEAMKRRVTVPKYHGSRYYIGKQIECDPLWLSFAGFCADMAATHTPHFVLHRIDHDIMYCESNCVWLPKAEHAGLHRRLQAERQTTCKWGHPFNKENTPSYLRGVREFVERVQETSIKRSANGQSSTDHGYGHLRRKEPRARVPVRILGPRNHIS